MFHVFRRSPKGYWCYQEPIHEVALCSRGNIEDLLKYKGDMVAHLRHPFLEKSYFHELHEIEGCWRDILTKEIIYDDYFGKFAKDARAMYLNALIKGAQGRGRAVIQECRTASRIDAIRQDVGGVHLYLWRNPWDQWWSYKVTDYFDTVNQLILNAPDHPEVVTRLKNEIGFKDFHNADIQREIANFSERRLSAENSYLVFYALWCLGLIEGMSYADALLNIDELSDSPVSRETTLHHLAALGITGLDFSDCEVPQTRYGDNDRLFFQKLEDHVHELLFLTGYAPSQIDSLRVLRQSRQPRMWNVPISELNTEKLISNAVSARDLLRRFESREAHNIHRLDSEKEALKVSVLELSIREQKIAAEARQLEARVNGLEQRAESTKGELAQFREQVQALGKELSKSRDAEIQLQKTLSAREMELAAVYRSSSWRLTALFRKVGQLVK